MCNLVYTHYTYFTYSLKLFYNNSCTKHTAQKSCMNRAQFRWHGKLFSFSCLLRCLKTLCLFPLSSSSSSYFSNSFRVFTRVSAVNHCQYLLKSQVYTMAHNLSLYPSNVCALLSFLISFLNQNSISFGKQKNDVNISFHDVIYRYNAVLP